MDRKGGSRSATMPPPNTTTAIAVALPIFLLILGLGTGGVSGLNCIQCGQYTDGVGSITPCVNYTSETHLRPCPQAALHCVKYVSEGSVVRDCAAQCVDKGDNSFTWGTKIFCCSEDGCNHAHGRQGGTASLACWLAVASALALQQSASRY